MRSLPALSIFLLLCACSEAPGTDGATVAQHAEEAGIQNANAPSEANGWTPQDDVVELFVTIADTGREYHPLDVRMYQLAEAFHAEVDTLGRYHDGARDSLILPFDNEDALYAGQYFPRRYAGGALSIEYLDRFDRSAAPRTYALVTGLWSTEHEADSALTMHRVSAPKAYKLKARVYQGCMH